MSISANLSTYQYSAIHHVGLLWYQGVDYSVACKIMLMFNAFVNFPFLIKVPKMYINDI